MVIANVENFETKTLQVMGMAVWGLSCPKKSIYYMCFGSEAECISMGISMDMKIEGYFHAALIKNPFYVPTLTF